MDRFVRDKLIQWDLEEWTERFEDINENLIPKLGPRVKFKRKLKLLKEEQNTNGDTDNIDFDDVSAQNQQQHEEATDLTEVLPSTSDNGKRKLDLQGESSEWQLPAKRLRDSTLEAMILSDVKTVMGHVYVRLLNLENTKLNTFLRTKITDLATDKRELVGVFGRTGTGKSSLINAIIGEKNLLPTGSVSACTSVMIKVEANMHNMKYEADIEFITKEDWKDELWAMNQFFGDKADEEREDDDHDDIVEKLSALYGDEWKDKSPENLMDSKYFREIPEFLQSRKKTLTCESAQKLSAKFVKYTRNGTEQGESGQVKRWYWPLVKCVTVRVPQSDLLQHVTIVDLPGNGDRNKSRDEMWKGVVGNCSTVWIVAEINRAAADKESWEILKSVSGLIGNGGECQHIHFICTKSDGIEELDEDSADKVRARIFKRNTRAKEEVCKEFRKLHAIKKHFSDDCFKVFTVSSKEFLRGKLLNQEETEISTLQDFLKNLNDAHSVTFNFVSGAHGILSLIKGAGCKEVADKKTEVCEELERNISLQLESVNETMKEVYRAFERCLSEGVNDSKSSCEKKLKNFLYPIRKSGGGFHKILKSVVINRGIYKPKKGKPINLNVKLASFLTDSIDEEFKRTFPNEGKCDPFNGVINTFSLDTERLIKKYKDVELQLIFLRTEEDKIKAKLKRHILDCKKTIYSSLMKTVEETMQECYERAAGFCGKDSLLNMRHTIERHVQDSKDTMFDKAGQVMLNLLIVLMNTILGTLEKTMKESIELSLKTNDYSIPDVSTELAMVQKLCNELKSSSYEEKS
ncbi:nuclear GTPase SLIP-GC-like isoform 2-T3 [Odontesthes bonariensis]|uniref:nuclear GTPase SLIP-GC-like isoform X2 n=1 Tax=Odontesthes bonariensis TaxID=219752 RepID=UPI003F582A24